jgi:hypothetical protein
MTGDEYLIGALLDVRKAYRLLYAFHQRVFAMARGINDSLDGYTFRSGEAGYDFLKKWSPQDEDVEFWETLPFYSTIFMWAKCKEEIHLAKKSKHLNLSDRFLAVEVLADVVGDDAEESDPNTFEQPPESSRTVMRCFFGRPLKECDGVSIMDAWNVDVQKIQLATRSKKGEFVLWWEDLDLATMPTKDDVVRAIDDFIERAELGLKSA